MSESQFIQEVRHRADMLTGSFNPGKAIMWVQKTGNYQRIQSLQEETRKYLSGDFTPQEVSEFWCGLESSPEIKAFIYCLDPGAHVLSRRGMKGDIYSIPVLHCVVRHFIQQYLQPGMQEKPVAAAG
ncbi:hypothetical protein MDN04_004610 [Salmonella enterica]|uniref:hypothetical protein n=1 Tax=Salmonella enterica TaxID=28901 RepID=UPI00159300D2|nr:hypothetical protein [Salmonella enterica]EHM2213795.1 hypothetical protein [Salmonella enterica]EHM5445504.1 hypothetical protein [Salmonella enterica]EHX7196874.1 hypothetical protein [Salmonella enterica]EHZ7709640.1 hypothetical protein [Salmonella enterica]EHZ8489816.1 hypothetical protein [Salmonella enterica]